MTDRWIGFCAFHLGDYQRALAVYLSLENSNPVPEDNAINLACCYFFLGMYSQVDKVSKPKQYGVDVLIETMKFC